MCFRIIGYLLIAVLALVAPPSHANHPSPLPFELETGTFDYNIFFDASNPYDCSVPIDPADPPAGVDLNYLPITQALNMADALDSDDNPVPGFPAGYHSGYLNLGFKAPDFGGEDDEVLSYNCVPGGVHDDENCDNGLATATRIIIPATRYCNSSERNLRRVMGHELFHHVQFAYAPASEYLVWGRMAYEGTARMMEDEIYADIDEDDNLKFWNQVRKYLDNPNRDFWRISYDTALGWKYMAEQFGTTSDEPQVGVDFIRAFWETIEANNDNPDLPATVEETINTFDSSTSLKSWFHDFTIVNVAKEFDASNLAEKDKYRYIDENDGNGVTYSNVARTWTGDIFAAVPAVSAVSRWGAAYYEATIPTACLPGWFMGYRVAGADDARHAVLAITDTGKAERLIRGGGDEFAVSFLQRDITGRYGRLIAVVTGSDDQIAFNYEFDCGPGSIDVRLPNKTYRAVVGPSDAPRTMIVGLLVAGPQGLGGPIVLGLQAEDFRVHIGNDGNPADEATVLAGAHVQGEYWLTVRPPVKPNQATYDLHVSMKGGLFQLTDTQTDSVSYEQRILDQVLVVDRSGSMGGPEAAPKIDAAKNAAQLFVDTTAAQDKLGSVSFSGDGVEPNNDATVDEGLADATDLHRQALKSAIAAIAEGGGTSIGDGLDAGAAEFAINGSADGEDWIVLLSDGMENEAQSWNQVKAAIKAAGVRVNTIALGADADQVLLQEIANETSGQYYYVDVGTAAVSALVAGHESTVNRLADAFASASETMKGHERLWEVEASLAVGHMASYSIEVSGDGIVNATFLFNWDRSDDALGVEILRPDGTTVVDGVAGAEVFTDATHVVAQVGQLDAGEWTINLSADAGTPSYLGILSGDDVQGPELSVHFAEDGHNNPILSSLGVLFLRGLPQPIVAKLVDRFGMVTGAEVVARIEHPDGRVIVLPLFDDGLHQDGPAQDGVYANLYTRTTQASMTDQPDTPGAGTRGSYNVVVEAQNSEPGSSDFRRIRKASFQVFETNGITDPGIPPIDSDKDGMPNRYEELHDCLKPNIADGQIDAEEDSRTNFAEWNSGTDPCHPDTDRGGETDVSELERGANPFDPDDDALPRPIDPEVIDWIPEHVPLPSLDQIQPGANLIRYPVNPAYDQTRLLRSTSPYGPFHEVALFSAQAQAGLYQDVGLSNGQTYFYKAQGVDINGNLSAPSHVFHGTPKAEPIPPIGSVLINAGAPVTKITAVRLSLTAAADTTEVLIGNDSRFSSSLWQPFAPSLAWAVDPDAASGIATVFVRYRDAAGNESPSVYHDSVRVVPPDTVGTIRGTALLAPRTFVEGIVLETLGPGDTPLEFTKFDGFFQIRDIPAGTYDLRVSYPGYITQVIEDLPVNGGSSINVGFIELSPQDTEICEGDFDQDGDVDGSDIDTFRNNLDPTQCTGTCLSDFDGDGDVNEIDFSVFSTDFGRSDCPK